MADDGKLWHVVAEHASEPLLTKPNALCRSSTPRRRTDSALCEEHQRQDAYCYCEPHRHHPSDQGRRFFALFFFSSLFPLLSSQAWFSALCGCEETWESHGRICLHGAEVERCKVRKQNPTYGWLVPWSLPWSASPRSSFHFVNSSSFSLKELELFSLSKQHCE